MLSLESSVSVNHLQLFFFCTRIELCKDAFKVFFKKTQKGGGQKRKYFFFSHPAAEIPSCIFGKLGQSNLLTM